jgi:hypothetical protein
MDLPRDHLALATEAAARMSAGLCFICGRPAINAAAISCPVHGLALRFRICEDHDEKYRWPADRKDLADWMLHSGWGESLGSMLKPNEAIRIGPSYPVNLGDDPEPDHPSAYYPGVEADARLAAARVQRRTCFVCGGSPIVAFRLVRCFVHNTGDLIPVCALHYPTIKWPLQAQALAAWMIHNGSGTPLESVAAPAAGQIVGETDPYFVPIPEERWRFWRQLLRVLASPLFRSLLYGLVGIGVVGELALVAAWAIKGQRADLVIAVAAAVQAVTAVAIVALTRRLANTAAEALWTSSAQTTAMFEANLQARIQRETEAMAVLQLELPVLRAVPPDEVHFEYRVTNTSAYPALTVSLQMAQGPWPRNWDQPPHEWVDAHSISRTNDVGVLPASAHHDFLIRLTREWAGATYTVRVEASGLFGGRIWQTWEMELTKADVSSWRQLEVFVLPRTPGAEPIQHRPAI